MQVVISDHASPASQPLLGAGHERYGPYVVFPQYRQALDFGGTRSFELLVAAFCDPRVVPQFKAARRRLNGIAVVWHGPRHEVIILEGLESVERANLKRPTAGQVAAFHHLARLTWEDFRGFCQSSPATRPSWRQALPWSQLDEVDFAVMSSHSGPAPEGQIAAS